MKTTKRENFFFLQGYITTDYTHSQLHPTVSNVLNYCKQLAQPSLWIYCFQFPYLQITPGLVELTKMAYITTPEVFFKLVQNYFLLNSSQYSYMKCHWINLNGLMFKKKINTILRCNFYPYLRSLLLNIWHCWCLNRALEQLNYLHFMLILESLFWASPLLFLVIVLLLIIVKIY